MEDLQEYLSTQESQIGIIGNNMEQGLEDHFRELNYRLYNIQAMLLQDRQERRNLNRQILQALNRLNAPQRIIRRGRQNYMNLGARTVPMPRQAIRNQSQSQRLLGISHLQRSRTQPSRPVIHNYEYSFGERARPALDRRAVVRSVPRPRITFTYQNPILIRERPRSVPSRIRQ